MIHEKYDKHTLAKVKSERPFAKRLFSQAIIGMLLLTSILMIFSYNAQAESYKVQVSWNNPADGTADVTPGQWYTYTVDVENTGENFGEDINLTAEFTDPNKENEGWSVSPAFLQFELDQNDVVPKIIKIRPPSNASFEDDAQVIVKAEVVGHVSEQGATSQLTLYATVIQVFGVANTIKDQDNIHNVTDGSYTVFYLNITNTGNGNDDFSLSYSGLPPGWPTPSFSSDQVLDLPSDSTTEISFQVNVPLNAESTSYTLSTIATSQGNPSKFSSASVTIQVIAKYKVSIDADPSQSNGIPGEQKDYQITIRNKSNIEEDFTITVNVIEGPSWSESISIGPNPTLAYQENLTFTLTVIIGSNANDDEFNRVEVIATPQDNPTANQSVICRTNVDQEYGVQVTSPTKKTVDPDDDTWFHVNIRNTGNGVDTINIETSGAFGGGTSNETFLDNMQPDEIRSINVTVLVPEGAPAGIQEITVTGTSDTDPTTSDYGTIQVDVNERFEVSVVPNGPSSLAGLPGEDPVVYEIRVKNAGTGIDDILLDLEGQKPTWATLSLPVVNDLAPGDFAIVFVNVTIPTGEQVHDWFINVTGESDGDNSSTSMVSLRLKVDQIYGLSLSTSDDSHSIPADSTTHYDIIVKNTGTGFDDFTVIVRADDPTASTWASRDPSSFGLFSGQEEIVNITVEVPLGTNPGIYNIWVIVNSTNGTDISESILTITQVTQTYDVLIATGSEDSGESPPNSVISYEIEVRNTGSGTDSFVIEKIGEPESNHQDWAILSENFSH
jgi:uncharacterized membrane protein